MVLRIGDASPWFIAIHLCAMGVILTTISLAAPQWSTIDRMSSDSEYGVWGYCYHMKIVGLDEQIKDKDCRSYYVGDENETIDTSDDPDSIDSAFCNKDDYASDSDRFQARTCGPVGKSTLSFAVLSMSFGVFMFIGLILARFLFKDIDQKMLVVKISIGCGLLTCIFCLIAIVVWVHQTVQLRDLYEEHNFGMCWYMEFIAVFFFGGSMVLAAKYEKAVADGPTDVEAPPVEEVFRTEETKDDDDVSPEEIKLSEK